MPSNIAVVERRPLDPALRLSAFALGIAFCCWWSIAFTRGPYGLSTLWVASGVL